MKKHWDNCRRVLQSRHWRQKDVQSVECIYITRQPASGEFCLQKPDELVTCSGWTLLGSAPPRWETLWRISSLSKLKNEWKLHVKDEIMHLMLLANFYLYRGSSWLCRSVFSVTEQEEEEEGGSKRGGGHLSFLKTFQPAQRMKTCRIFRDKKELRRLDFWLPASIRVGACDWLERWQSPRSRSWREAEGRRVSRAHQREAGVGWSSLAVSSPPSASGQWPGEIVCVCVGGETEPKGRHSVSL